jgi:HD superfamily phosphohydrolase YqeK
VRELVIDWGTILNLAPEELLRWKAAATLHDAMRDADAAGFGPDSVYPEETGASWPRHLLHGPACAFLLRSEGVEDIPLLRAVAYHTTGHADLDEMGEYLYLADFLDPGRHFRHEERRAMRERLPEEPRAVLQEVIGLRTRYLIDPRSNMLPETLCFWNRVAEEEG